MVAAKSTASRRASPAAAPPGHRSEVAEVMALSRMEPEASCRQVGSSTAGLTRAEAARRLRSFGPNLVTRERKPTVLEEIWSRARNPLNALLLALAVVSYFLGDLRAAIVIVAIVLLAVTTAFLQEHRSNEAAARLRAMVKTTASVRRRSAKGDGDFREIPIERLVPGDVVSGYGVGVVVRTGGHTFFGKLADEIAGRRVPTAFDLGVERFTWLMIKVMAVMVPAVFLINGLTKHNWLEALLFAVAVAVGLTPELLPMIVTVNLAKG